MLSSEFSYSYPAEGDLMEGLTCSWPPSQTWMLLSYVGLSTRISFHCNPPVPFCTLEPSYSILDGFGQPFCLSSDGQSPWSPPGVVYHFLFPMSFLLNCVCVCVAWSGGLAVIQSRSAWLHIGLEDRNFLLPRIPRPALLTINPALPALLHF